MLDLVYRIALVAHLRGQRSGGAQSTGGGAYNASKLTQILQELASFLATRTS